MPLISDEYAKLMRETHADPRFGAMTDTHEVFLKNVESVMRAYPTQSILDYGAGKGVFKEQASRRWPSIQISEYDPGIPGKDVMPSPADLVVASDVMEHIEPPYLTDVLIHIASLTKKVFFTQIALRPAKRILPDGRNAHLIVETDNWWARRISDYLNVARCAASKNGNWVTMICTPRMSPP